MRIEDTALQRAPNQRSTWTHEVGVAGELATAAYFGVEANWDIYDDYEGDDGYDIDLYGTHIEVKTVTEREDTELRVPEEKVDSADHFVLAQCWNPKEHVRLIGSISRPRLKSFGHRFGGDYRVYPNRLSPLRPLEVFPERVRETQL